MSNAKAKTASTPKFDDAMAMSVEVPAAVREFAEKGLEQARDGYARMKSVAEETTDAVEDTISTATKGCTDMNLKALDMAKTNVNATFDFWKSMFGAKTMSDMVELNTGFARTQYETMVAQSKELSELAGDVAKSSAAPMADTYKKAMKDFKLPA